MNTLEFLQRIFHATNQNLFTYLWTRDEIDKKKHQTQSFSIKNLTTMAASSTMFNKIGTHVSFSMGLTDHFIPYNQRAKDQDIIAIPCLWCDIDVASEFAHAHENLLPSFNLAMKVFPPEFEPTIIVNSGYGLHAYWIFDEILDTSTQSAKDLAKSMLSTLQNRIRKIAAPYFIDPTANLSMMLRIPGSRNWKGNKIDDAPISSIIHVNDSNYSISHVQSILQNFRDQELAEIRERTPKSPPQNIHEILYNRQKSSLNTSPMFDSADLLFDHCNFLRYIRDNISSISYPDFKYSFPTILHSKNGRDIAIKLCQLKFGSNFDSKKSESYLDSLSTMSPVTCNTIKSLYPNLCNCDDCIVPKNSKNSPIAISNSPKIQSEIYGGTPISHIFPDAPNDILDLVIPDGFEMNQRGIVDYRRKYPQDVADSPILISSLVKNVSTGFEDIECRTLIRKKWISFIIPANILPNSQKLAETLATYGVNVNAKQSRNISEFLGKFKSLNEEHFPIVLSYNKLGWIRDSRGKVTDFILPTIDSSERRIFTCSPELKKQGDRQVSIDLLRKISKYPFARILTDSNLAAPLLNFTNCRPFVLNLHAKSHHGKTMALQFANSLWGSPQWMQSFNSTSNFVENCAADRNDLPLNINEWQLVSDHDQDTVANQIVHRYTEGLGRGRADRNGKNREQTQWKGILNVTAEEPLTKSYTRHGVKTRVLEIKASMVIGTVAGNKEFLDQDLCKDIWEQTQSHYGNLGAEYIQFILNMEDREHFFKNMQKTFYDIIINSRSEQILESQAEYLASISIAHFLANKIFLKQSDADAMQDTIDFIKFFSPFLPTVENLSDVQRAKDSIEDFVNINFAYFNSDENQITRKFGFFKDDHVYIFPSILRDCLKSNGFSYVKLIEELEDAQFIVCGDGGSGGHKGLMISDPRFPAQRKRVIELAFLRGMYTDDKNNGMTINETTDDNPPEVCPF